MAFHGLPEEFQSGLAITALRDKAFKDFPLVINGPPKVVRLAVNLHEHLIQMPLPMYPSPHSINPSTADLSGKHRAKSVPPRPNRLMADVDAGFMQKIFHIPQRERKPHIHHNSQADDLGARLKMTKGGRFCHPATLSARPARLKKRSSDNALWRITGCRTPVFVKQVVR
jgi:hypothetical protein